MQRALVLARRGRGRTAPNPIVGAVVVRNGECVGEGFHARAGEAHAEVVALREAGARARGATLYVTLEPCCHAGRTPPCAPAVVEAGVRRVVSAMEDPDPRVRGAGHRELREGGLEVAVGVEEATARRDNAEFVHRVSTGRAFGVLKAAITLDGRLAADGGDSRWITGPEARERAHELRDRYDAVLIGRGTLSSDDPRLDVRLAGERRNPRAVVVDSRLRTGADRVLYQRAKEGAQVLVATTDKAPDERVLELRALGVDVRVLPADEGGVSLPALFRELAATGSNSVLIEGGEAVLTSALRHGLVQRVHVFVAAKILGGSGGPRLVGDLGIDRVERAVQLDDVEWEAMGGDLFLTGSVR